jgi:hypothetical protein
MASAPKNYSGAAIICAHAASGKYPIMIAERSEPADDLDTGWQFLCMAESHNNVEDAKIWGLDEILDLEPSLRDFVDQPPGTRLLRKSPNSAWEISKLDGN